jgi:uncharacterized RDD family membrane protein YckC
MQPEDPNRPLDHPDGEPSRAGQPDQPGGGPQYPPPAEPASGQPQYRQPQYGQPPQGQPQYGPPPSAPEYGQPPPSGPQYGQPPGAPQYGQPQYGQPQYGQPQYGQPQYGQPQYGQPQYGQPQYGQPYPPAGAYPVAPYAPWIVRVASFLIDWVIPAIVVGIGQIILYSGTQPVGGGYAGWRVAVSTILDILSVVIWGYNRWYRAGRTGQSWGKQALSTKLIGEASGQPIGAWRAFVRDVCHIFDNLCGIFPLGYLWPLWDRKRQIFSDKIMHTVVIRV